MSIGRSLVRWLVPALLLVIALFAESCGLYFGTWSYIKWLDEWTQEPLPPSSQSIGSSRAAPMDELGVNFSLQDVAFVQLPQGFAEGWAGTAVDALTASLFPIWFCWVVCVRDLRTWTQVLVSAAILACAKGLLAWATVLPSADGWDRCREKLGAGGLASYDVEGAPPLDRHLKQIMDLWPLVASSDLLLPRARQPRDRICGDSALCSSTAYGALLATSLFRSIMNVAEERCGTSQQVALRLSINVLLAATLTGAAVLPVLRRENYTLDVALALVLAVLVYGSPAVVIFVGRWVGEDGTPACAEPVHRVQGLRCAEAPPFGPSRRRLGQELHLRSEPLELEGWNALLDSTQLQHFRQLKEQQGQRLLHVEELLWKARADAQAKLERQGALLDQRHEEEVAALTQRLDNDEQQVLADLA